MRIDFLNTYLPIIDHISSKYNTNNIKSITELKKELDYRTFVKYIPYSQREIIASEKSNEQVDYNPNIKYLNNVPINQISNSNKLYNEPTKTYRNNSFRNYIYYNKYNNLNTTEHESKMEKGYYIIINTFVNKPDRSNKNQMSLKINKAYKTDYYRKPGVLVNIIV